MSGVPDVQVYLEHLGEYIDQQPVKSLNKAVLALKKPYPTWVLAPDATIRAANLLSAWLWGALGARSGTGTGTAGASRLLGQSALSVINQNLDRIDLKQNQDFAVAHLALIERLSSTYKRIRPHSYELAHSLYSANRELIRLHEGYPSRS